MFPEQKTEFEEKISNLLSSHEAFVDLDIRLLDYISPEQYFTEPLLFEKIKSSCPEVTDFLKLCFSEKLKCAIDYQINKAEVLDQAYNKSKSQLLEHIALMQQRLLTADSQMQKRIRI